MVYIIYRVYLLHTILFNITRTPFLEILRNLHLLMSVYFLLAISLFFDALKIKRYWETNDACRRKLLTYITIHGLNVYQVMVQT